MRTEGSHTLLQGTSRQAGEEIFGDFILNGGKIKSTDLTKRPDKGEEIKGEISVQRRSFGMGGDTIILLKEDKDRSGNDNYLGSMCAELPEIVEINSKNMMTIKGVQRLRGENEYSRDYQITFSFIEKPDGYDELINKKKEAEK